MRLLNKLTILAVISSTLAGVASNLIIKWPEAYGLALLLAGCVATVSVNAVYEEWDKRRPKRAAKVEEMHESKVEGGQKVLEISPPAVMLHCESCGTILKGNCKFCTDCGARLQGTPGEPLSRSRVDVREGPAPQERAMVPVREGLAYDMLDVFNTVGDVIQSFQQAVDSFGLLDAKLANGSIGPKTFSSQLREMQAEVDALKAKGEAKVSELGKWKKALEDYLVKVQERIEDVEAKSARTPEDKSQAIVKARKIYQNEEQIARSLKLRTDRAEVEIGVGMSNLDLKVQEATLKAIDATSTAIVAVRGAEVASPKA